MVIFTEASASDGRAPVGGVFGASCGAPERGQRSQQEMVIVSLAIDDSSGWPSGSFEHKR